MFQNPSEKSRRFAPLLVVLQSDLTMTETTVVVAPLVMQSRMRVSSRLFPALVVGGRRLILPISELGAIRRTALAEPVASLVEHRDEIVAALDLLFLGV